MKKNEKQNQEKELQVAKDVGSISTALAGAVANPKSAVKALSHVFSGLITQRLGSHFVEAYEFLLKEGSIDKKYFEQPFVQNQFQHVLSQINSDTIDENRVRHLINIYLNAAKVTKDELDGLRVSSLMSTLSKLDSTDIYILGIISSLRKESLEKGSSPAYDNYAHNWSSLVFKKSGLEIQEILDETEIKLIGLKIISDRVGNDKGAVEVNLNYRLTELGIRLCALMEDPWEKS